MFGGKKIKSHKKILGTFLIALMMLSMVGTAAAQMLTGETEDEKRIVGSGTLYAEGKGKALLKGTCWVSLKGAGKMIIIGKDVR